MRRFGRVDTGRIEFSAAPGARNADGGLPWGERMFEQGSSADLRNR